MEPRERAIRQRLKDDFPHYAARCLRIRPKTGGLRSFELNGVQRRLHARIEAQRARRGRVRVLVLKARQPGVSTYVAGRFFWRVTHSPGLHAFILTHRNQATDNLFAIAKRFQEHCPAPVRPTLGSSNAKELRFSDLDSGYRVGTASAAGVGRSETIQCFHGSEVAFWPRAEEHAAGILQAVPDADGTEVILESTANGLGGVFYDLCRAAERGEGDFELVFIPWFWHADYRRPPPDNWVPPAAFLAYERLHGLGRPQTYWAYAKNRELAVALAADPEALCWKFHQEYPATAQDAFQSGGGDSLIASDLVLRARRQELPAPGPGTPLVLGVDVARGGADKTRILDRQGRRYGHRVNRTLACPDLMQVAGILAAEIERLRPDRVFIDATGGYGAAVYDRLKELGFRGLVSAVEFGGRARDPEAFANRRAEIWAALRDHLREPGGCDLVDDEELHRHLCAPGYSFDSSGRLLLERKEEIKKRLGFSPDAGDAAALTHAEPLRRRDGPRTRPPRAEGDYRVHGW